MTSVEKDEANQNMDQEQIDRLSHKAFEETCLKNNSNSFEP